MVEGKDDPRIKVFIAWLNGMMPSEKLTSYEKDFSEAPIYKFYLERRKDFSKKKPKLTKLWDLVVIADPKTRREIRIELEELLELIKRP